MGDDGPTASNGSWRASRASSRRSRSPRRSAGMVNRLSDLPQNEFLPEELSLRDALFDFIDDFERTNRKRGSQPWSSTLPRVSEAAASSAVRRCYTKLLAPHIKLEQWINLRMGAELK